MFHKICFSNERANEHNFLITNLPLLKNHSIGFMSEFKYHLADVPFECYHYEFLSNNHITGNNSFRQRH